jgi:transposase-like protein
MTKRKRGQFSGEVRERAIRLVREQTPHHSSQWAAIGAIAPKLGCTPETLRRWVREAKDARPTPAEEDRLKVLERENRELRRANDILRKASAFFAAAELDRHIR